MTPYNTKNEGFIYSDKFDREELEVLGFENINDDDYRRMEFSFSSKSSHNGWLSFIYPRLKLARDLLANDGIIFVSIDDNEQANLKILMDEIFGEENFVACLPRNTTTKGKNDEKQIANSHDYVLVYAKLERFSKDSNFKSRSRYKLEDNIGKYYCEAPLDSVSLPYAKNLDFEINFNGKKFNPIIYNGNKTSWRWSQDLVKFGIENNLIVEKENRLYSKTYLEYEIKKQNGEYKIIKKQIGGSFKSQMLINYKYGNNEAATQLKNFEIIFDYSKPFELISVLISLVPENENITILDFFAGSGTTAQAVMELNKKDGGNRKFILCQIDEPINEEKKKEAFDFCLKNGLEPVISSITIERVKRAGEKILTEIKEQKNLLNQEDKGLDAGFKVFDLIEASKIIEDANHQFNLALSNNDSLSKIYHLILKDGVFDLNAKIKIVIDDCLYLINDFRYYIINAEKLETPENKQLLNDILIDKNKDFIIDGFTASINLSLQQYQNKSRFKIIY